MAITAFENYEGKLKPKANQALSNAIGFIRKIQKNDGSFSESIKSFEQGRYVESKTSSPHQTAIVVSQILYAIEDNPRLKSELKGLVEKSVSYLMSTQNQDGYREDQNWAGVTFPGIEYINYYYVHTYTAWISLIKFNEIYL